ncbi:hypothetical protein D9615_004381 [Tricholomella constricta]|uniref:Uncharacterized protein n=1 Tax=Tricholomella constricta TaxID=117010 RepID=A0A8H5M685_9AGAR|nr:hypothetical protein D9615_004381 [Tricholomella constricta]
MTSHTSGMSVSEARIGGTATVDFVITRKRKRQSAIDPCLGFYSTPEKSSIPGLTPQPEGRPKDLSAELVFSPSSASMLPCGQELHVSSSNSELTVDAATKSSDADFTSPSAHTSDPAPVPIELFLQRNARRIHVKKYGRRRNRVIQVSSSPASDNDLVDQLDEDDLPKASKRIQRPIAGSENYEGPSKSASRHMDSLSRPSLQLVPVNLANAPEKTTKHRAIRPWTKLDPKKGISLRSACFSRTDPKTFASSTKHRSLNAWKTLGGGASLNKGSKTSTSVAAKRTVARCPPLLFVPLAEAEAAYSTKIHADKAKNATSSSAHRYKLTASAPLHFLPAVATLQIPSGHIRLSSPSPNTHSSIVGTLSKDLTRPETPARRRSFRHPSSSERLSPTVCAIRRGSSPSDYGDCSDDLQSSTILLSQGKILLDNDYGDNDELNIPGTPTSSPARTIKKPMKPLVSFLDEFLERARTATLIHDALSTCSKANDLRRPPTSLTSSGNQTTRPTGASGQVSPPTSLIATPNSAGVLTVDKLSPSHPFSPSHLSGTFAQELAYLGEPATSIYHSASSSSRHLDQDGPKIQTSDEVLVDIPVEIDYGTSFGDSPSDDGMEP